MSWKTEQVLSAVSPVIPYYFAFFLRDSEKKKKKEAECELYTSANGVRNIQKSQNLIFFQILKKKKFNRDFSEMPKIKNFESFKKLAEISKKSLENLQVSEHFPTKKFSKNFNKRFENVKILDEIKKKKKKLKIVNKKIILQKKQLDFSKKKNNSKKSSKMCKFQTKKKKNCQKYFFLEFSGKFFFSKNEKCKMSKIQKKNTENTKTKKMFFRIFRKFF
nr:hypothetical protein Y57A10A.t - Caenorhabditis elegans [Caenorhabditis elegans]